MNFLGARNAISLGVSPHAVLSNGPILNRLAPSLLLEFAGAETLDPRITFTRASNATRFNSAGTLVTMGNNEPRFDYDPVTLAPKGLLIEEQRTNLVTYSEQFDDAAWTKTRASITANAAVSPDGTMDADKLVEDSTAANTHQIQRSISYTSGTIYTRSLYAKAAERTGFRFQFPSSAFTSALNAYFDLGTGTVANVSAGVTATITPVGNGWYRCTATATATTTATATEISCGLAISGTNPIYTGDGTSGIFIWGAQLEVGNFATSYIPTVASQVTRAADLAVMTGTNFSSWYNATEGTWFADFTPATSSYLANKNLFLASDGTTSNFNGLRYVSSGAAPGLGVTAAGVTQASLSTGAMVANRTYKMAGAYKLNDFAVSRNGAAVVVDTSGTISTVTQAEIGTLAGLNVGTQHIRRIAYYNRRLTNAELQGITA